MITETPITGSIAKAMNRANNADSVSPTPPGRRDNSEINLAIEMATIR